ncbi:MAG: hypothetical protein IJD28_07150, partial [Deferribacterales bacterium]|nr:hypothetical protein [Deferribacterales bacterium]
VTEPINTPKDYTPSFIPSGMETPMILPDIQLPESLTEAVPEIVIPDISGINESESISSLEGVSVKQELASVETARPNSDKNENPFDNKSEKASKVLSEGQIYNFDILPSNNRKLSYIPPEPEFALENDAKVTLKFSIDRNGNTSDIIFVTRNDGRVEALAYDYIRRMRFEAVLHDAKDTAQITLTFKVIK